MNDSETTRLIKQAQSGNSLAREQLLLRHRDRLKRFIAIYFDSRLSARLDPSDIFQDAMARAAQELPQFLGNPSIGYYPWIRQIVRDQLIDINRKHLKAQCRSVQKEAQMFNASQASAAQLVDYLVGSTATPSVLLQRDERRMLVRTALGQLDQDDQEILLMRFVEQLSISEIAQVLSITEAAAKSRLRRALEKMCRLVNRMEKDPHDP